MKQEAGQQSYIRPVGAGGEIRVTLAREANAEVLTVADDGVGLPPDFVSAARSTTMGLQLADGLARQLGGELLGRTELGAVLSARLTRL